MLFLTTLIPVIAIFPVRALAAPADFNGTATIKDAPAPNQTTNQEPTFPDALAALNRTVSRARAVHDAGSEGEDPNVFDDLERLLEIIAGHVERMREATHGTDRTNTPPATATFQAKAPVAHHAATNTTADSNTKVLVSAAGEAAQAAGAPASHDSNTNNDDDDDDSSATTTTTEKTPDGPAVVIINQADMFPNGDADADHDGTTSTTQVGGGPEVQYDESSGAINITCKGISVCNPVTIINEKGGKKLKLDKLEKAAEKGREKAGKAWRD